MAPDRGVCRPHSQWRAAIRSARPTSHPSLSGHQFENSQSTRPHHSSNDACPCRRGDRMRRRHLLLALGASAAWPVFARAQQAGRTRRIGVLFALPESDRTAQARLAMFRGELQKLGWTDITWDTRFVASNDTETHQRYAKELVALQPDLLLAQNTQTTAALLQETRTIPLIFTIVSDPVGEGFVASFPRPGGNVTGFIVAEPSMGGKWLELLREVAPNVTRVLVPFNTTIT